MNIYSLSALKPMVVDYRLDDDITIPNYVTNFLYGLNLYSNNLFNLARDISINYYNTFLLSDKFNKNEFITFTTPVSVAYTKTISSTLQTVNLSAYGRGFWTDYTENYSNSNYSLSCSTSIFSNGSVYNLGYWNVYEIKLLTENKCTISKKRSVPPYLSVENQARQYIDIKVDSGINYLSFVTLSAGQEEPVFNYIYNKNTNSITFYRNYQPTGLTTSTSILLLSNEEGRIVVKSLDASTISNIGLYNLNSIFLLSYRDADTRIGEFTTNYNSYRKYFYPTVDTSYTESLTGLKNNYLISSDVLFTDNKFLINFQPLKNQLDTNYNFTNNSSFSGSDFDNRDYQTIVTGTNQELGLPDLTLTYYTYNAPLQFKKGALTYFHFPVSSTPFNKLNINDTKLVENGAFAGDNPLDSDKVFKKLDITAKRDKIVDQQVGTYLCSWLYTSSFDSKPVWLDRYYNPNFTSLQDSFLNSGFVVNVTTLSAQKYTYFDKISDLVFEPNATYSYYRISEKDIKRATNLIEEKSLIQKTLNTFDLNYNLVSTQDNFINLTSNKGSVLQSLSSNGDISYVFSTKSKNYKNKKGSFIYSTYNGSTGLVVSNIKELNNFSLFTSAGEIIICDGNYEEISRAEVLLDKNTLLTPNKILSINYNNIIDGYYVTSCTTTTSGNGLVANNTNFYVSVLDSNFVTINTKPLTGFSGDYKGSTSNFVTSKVDENYYYSLINNFNVTNISSGNYDYFLTKIPLSGLEVKNVSLSSYTTKLNLPLTTNGNGYPLIDRDYFTNFKYTYNFSVSGGNIQYYITDYSNNSITQDIFDKPWYVFDNTIYHTVTNFGSLSGFNIVYDKAENEEGSICLNTITNITTDNLGNIYYISRNLTNNTGHTLVKLNNKRVPLFKTSLTSNVGLSAIEYLDIKYKTVNGEIKPYPVVVFDDYSVSTLSAGSFKGIIQFNENGKEILNKNLTFFSDTLITNSSNRIGITNSIYNNENIISKFKNDNNILNFDFYIVDKNNDREKISLPYNIKNLTNDDLYFSFTFNSRTGKATLYINSVEVSSYTTDSIKYAKCGFTNNINVNGLENLPAILFRGFYNTSDITLSKLNVFSKVLDIYDIRNLYLSDLKFENLNWNIPAGKRNIQETIQHNYKFGVQDYKTNLFDIIVTGTEGLNDTQKAIISEKIREYLKGNIPLNTVIKDIEIRDNE